VLLTFPWYISKETSLKMDEYFTRNFSWLRQLEEKNMTLTSRIDILPDGKVRMRMEKPVKRSTTKD
jgi:hypothetical protein